MFSHFTRALVALAVIVLIPGPAYASPAGAPQTVTLSADRQPGTEIRVTWRAGDPDNLAALAQSLGRPAAELGSSPEFSGYLLDHISVSAAGHTCDGTVYPVEALDTGGATVVYRCTVRIIHATVKVRMLTDVDQAYRTEATGPDGQRVIYDSADDTHTWSFPEPTRGAVRDSPFGQLAAAVVVLLLGAAALMTIRGRRRLKAYSEEQR